MREEFLERWSEPGPLPKDRGTACVSSGGGRSGLRSRSSLSSPSPAHSQNLLINPGFDRDLAGWDVRTEFYPPANVDASAQWEAVDALDGGSGSVRFGLHGGRQTVNRVLLSQCRAADCRAGGTPEEASSGPTTSCSTGSTYASSCSRPGLRWDPVVPDRGLPPADGLHPQRLGGPLADRRGERPRRTGRPERSLQRGNRRGDGQLLRLFVLRRALRRRIPPPGGSRGHVDPALERAGARSRGKLLDDDAHARERGRRRRLRDGEIPRPRCRRALRAREDGVRQGGQPPRTRGRPRDALHARRTTARFSSPRPSPNLVVQSETSTSSSGGTVGQALPAFGPADYASAAPKTLAPIRENESFRTNLVLSNPTEIPVTAHVALFAADGTQIGSRDVDLPPLGMTQINRVAAALGATSLDAGRISVSTPTPGGLVAAYASVIDNVTNDPRTLLPPLTPARALRQNRPHSCRSSSPSTRARPARARSSSTTRAASSRPRRRSSGRSSRSPDGSSTTRPRSGRRSPA